METALPLTSYLPTDIKMRARFASRLITLDDAYAFLGLLKEVISSVAAEVEAETGQEVLVLPTVKITHGSFEIEIDIKGPNWSVKLKANMRAAFLAAVLALSPTGAGPATETLSDSCRATIEATTQRTMETWEYHGKGYTAEFEVTCGPAHVKSTLHSPPNLKR